MIDTIASVIDLAQAGGIAVLLVIVWQLWNRLNVLTDRFITYLEERSNEGDVAAAAALDANTRRHPF